MNLRGIRGAITVTNDEPGEILDAVKELLKVILKENPTMQPEDLASVLFTVTEDLRSTFPAQAARQLGWVDVPLICAQEIPVSGSLELCIRVLLLWNTDLPQSEIKHIYLKGAAGLKPDLTGETVPSK